MRKKEQNKRIKLVCLWSVILLFVLVTIFFLLRYCLLGTESVNWLDFDGAYIGSATGAFVTFIAFYFTYRANTDTQDKINEQERISLLPMLSFNTQANESLKAFNSAQIDLGCKGDNIGGFRIVVWLTNIGQASAIRITLKNSYDGTPLDLGHIDNGDFFQLIIDAPPASNEIDYVMILKFYDLSGREYMQNCKLTIEPQKRLFNISPTTFPQTI